MENEFYYYGVFAGIVLGLLLVLIIVLMNRKKGLDKYDERQIAGRGKAFRAGFFTLLIGMGILSLDGYIYELPGSPFLWKFGTMMAGLMAFVLTAIHHDAYLSLTDTPKRIYTTGLLFAAAMGLNAVSNFMSDSEYRKMLASVSLTLAVSWLIILAAVWIHNRRGSKEDEE